MVAGLVAYLVLGLALVTLDDSRGREVVSDPILAGAAFFLVGALVGLFRQLHIAGTKRLASEEDYGLTAARLIMTPLLSGIAAVAGAALVKLLPHVTGCTELCEDDFTLGTVFDLENWPQGLVWAAIFGFTPTLVLARLQQGVDEYREDLLRTGPGERELEGAR